MTVASFVLAIYTAVRSANYPSDYDDEADENDLDMRIPSRPFLLSDRMAMASRADGEVWKHLKSAHQPYGDTEDVQEERGATENGPSAVDNEPEERQVSSAPLEPVILNSTALTGDRWWTERLAQHRTLFEQSSRSSQKRCQSRSGILTNSFTSMRLTSLTADGQKCAVEPVFLLIIIHSKSNHFDRRQIIRSTFGSLDNLRGRKIRLVFGLGEPSPDETATQTALNSEARLYGDLVQGAFREHNRNLTHNFQALLRWIGRYCPHASYIAKLDDDTFLDVGHLLDFLEYMPRRQFVYCAVARNRSPVRYAWSKWYVSRTDYPKRKFPNYCLGVGFVFSGDLAPQLLGCSLAAKIIPVDDVFYTGQVLRMLNQGLSAFWEGHTYAWLTPRLLQACDRKNFIFLASKQSVVMGVLWKKLWRTALLDSMNSWSPM